MLNKLVSINIEKNNSKTCFTYTKEFMKHSSMSIIKNSYIKDKLTIFYPEDVFLVLSELNDVPVFDMFTEINSKRSLYKILKDNKILIVDKKEFKTI
jgi:hypothetical protein